MSPPADEAHGRRTVKPARGGAGSDPRSARPAGSDPRSARPGRFELPTPGSVDQCSIQLSYGRFPRCGARDDTHARPAVNVVRRPLEPRVRSGTALDPANIAGFVSDRDPAAGPRATGRRSAAAKGVMSRRFGSDHVPPSKRGTRTALGMAGSRTCRRRGLRRPTSSSGVLSFSALGAATGPCLAWLQRFACILLSS